MWKTSIKYSAHLWVMLRLNVKFHSNLSVSFGKKQTNNKIICFRIWIQIMIKNQFNFASYPSHIPMSSKFMYNMANTQTHSCENITSSIVSWKKKKDTETCFKQLEEKLTQEVIDLKMILIHFISSIHLTSRKK